MKIIFKLILLFGVSLYLVLPALALSYYDINKPGIEKLKLSITANGSSDIIDPVVEQLRSQMQKTLLFNIVDDSDEATYNLDINPTPDEKVISVKLSGAQGTSFEAITTGMKFRNEDEEYINLKSSQLGNFLTKNLMGIKGSLGSILVWSAAVKGEGQNSLIMQRFGAEKSQKVTYNFYNNTGVSWNPKGDAIIYSAQTGDGSEVLWQGFLPLRLKSESIYFDEGKGSRASWGSNGKVYLAKYMGGKNTDIIEYEFVTGGTTPSLERIQRMTKHSAIETEPVLSPDGDTLAYISDRTGGPQIYLMDLSTKKSRRLTLSDKYNINPAWSPDGSMIAYCNVKNNKSTVFRLGVADNIIGLGRQVSPNGMNAESPVWSPDGSIIAYSANQGTGKGSNWKIYYSLSSGGSASRLTNSADGINETNPAWNSGLK